MSNKLFPNKSLIVFKGNSKYKISESKEFYDFFKELAKKYDYDYVEYESNIHASKVQKIFKKDIVICFSMGGFYSDKLKNSFGAKGTFINIGADDYVGADYYFTNPLDKTLDGDYSKDSLIAHWTLTSDMKDSITEIVKNK